MQNGWVKNTTPITQIIGHHEIDPNAVVLLPIAVVSALRSHPIPQLQVIEDCQDDWFFRTTDHLPFNERYKCR